MLKKIGGVFLSAALCLSALTVSVSAAPDKLKDYVNGNADFVPIDYDVDLDTLLYYSEYADKNKDVPGIAGETAIDVGSAAAADGKALEMVEEADGGRSLRMEKERDYTWRFTVPAACRATVYIDYIPVEGNVSGITRGVTLNGAVPFYEAQVVGFDRRYKDVGTIKTGANGDDIRPTTEEIYTWSQTGLYDNGGLYTMPFEFALKAGENTLSLTYVSGEMKIKSIRLAAAKPVPSYAAYRREHAGAKEASLSAPMSWEAEVGAERNDPSIRSVCDTDAATTPYSNGDYRLNALGDTRWCSGNQWASWTFTVEEAGLYTFYFRASQWYNDGRSSYRQVTIDGEVPFEELLAYEIPNARNWQNVALADEEGKPYQLYLDAGEHTIRLTTKIGYMASVSNYLERASLRMTEVLRSILKVTGYDIDKNYRYELEKKAPEVIEGFREILSEVEQMLAVMEREGNKPSLYYSLATAKKLLEDVTGNPDAITLRFSELSTLQSNFGTWMDAIRQNALGVDKWYVCAPGSEPPKATAGLWKGLSGSVRTFLKSFTKDYSSISAGTKEGLPTIRAWVSLGREWTEALRDMVDNVFTPRYGVQVQLNTFPSGQLNAGSANALMLAVNAGNAPDVGIGVAAASVGEFAMRGVVKDLRETPEFDAFSQWFIPNAFVPFTYEGGVFGVPCTQDFTVLYYRKDILSNLGLGIPQTWNDVYQMMAKLGADGYEFYFPQNPAPFIYQHGADYYSADLKKSGVDDGKFLQAFEQYTELFINYRVPTYANFFNRFRTGEMPVGVGGYDMYIQLSTAAPELKGRWGIYMLPGIRKEDGVIDRSVSSGSSTANVILSGSSYAEESWEFLQWFMGEETQVEYGKLVESIIGLGARWNSANLAAFQRLPWSSEEMQVITEQWKFNREIPIVPGSYATTRYLNFAWTDIVISGNDVRGTLEKTAESINREMDKKYAEFAKRRQP